MSELFSVWHLLGAGLLGMLIGFLAGIYYSMKRLGSKVDGMVDFDPDEFEEGLEALDEVLQEDE